jgi:exodeoxyribonuclease V beta subunit
MQPFDTVNAPLEGTALIEASAGTGKTHTIATLVVRLLVERGHAISEVLVVTYTRAATAELRERVRRRVFEAQEVFERVAAGAKSDEATKRDAQLEALAQRSVERGTCERDVGRLVAALRSFDQAAIYTIHGFCQRTLAERAFESRAAFQIELVDNQLAWLDEVVRDHYARELYGADEVFARFVREAKRLTPSSLLSLATDAARDPDLVVTPPARAVDLPAAVAGFEAARQRVHDLFVRDRDAIIALLSTPKMLNQQVYAPAKLHGKLLPALDAVLQQRPGELPAELSKLTTAALHARTNGAFRGGREPRHALFDAIQGLCDTNDDVTAVLEQRLLAFLHSLITYVRRELPARKAEQGVQAFDDLLFRLDAATSGSAGFALVDKIREAYPAALIDEFQDTDTVQCRVFQRIYDAHSKRPGVLFLIGDPKQAIYGFRGADVFAYVAAARREGTRAYTLGVNYRSDPSLVRAVNAVFAGAQRPFLFPEVQFHPVDARDAARDQLTRAGAHQPPLEILFLARSGDAVTSKGEAAPGIALAIAAEIVQLLASEHCIAGRRVEPRDLAVLCRTNQQARLVQDALRGRGVPAVLDGDSSVFITSAADELERVLAAVAEPTDAGLVRSALATSILGVDAKGLLALEASDTAWDGWLASFHAWHERWSRHGFMQALHALLDDTGVPARLLGLPDGERRLTDLTHLAELLHGETMRRRHGPLSLLAWYRRIRSGGGLPGEMAPQVAQIRMESDARAVTLTTIHKSKGLEYPIVYAPFLWDGRVRALSKAHVSFHDAARDNRATLVLSTTQGSAEVQRAGEEEQAENLRLLYVALTRAKHRLSVVWGAINEGEDGPLAYTLHQPPGAALDGLAAAAAARYQGASDDELRADLQRLVVSSKGAIVVRDLPTSPASIRYARVHSETALHARVLTTRHRDLIRLSSFSRLAAGRSVVSVATVDEAIEHDAQDVVASPPPLTVDDEPVLLAEFPSGPGPGTLIHGIYEAIDFRETELAALRPHVQGALAAYGVDAALTDVLCRGVSQTLVTPLGDTLPMLASVAPADRLVELEFVFPVALDEAAQGRLTARKLSQVLAQHARSAAERSYADRLGDLAFAPLRGYLRGFMDLVVRHEGRYFLIDYKSNHLGGSPRDYSPALLTAQMAHHHYVLQYLLYTVALDRYLAQRVHAYDYERCFGGVYYLFVRGMSPAHAPGTGVYFDRPPRALIEALSQLLHAPQAGEA